MPLFQKIPIKAEEVQKIISQNWKLKLGKLLKESQNHNFEAFSQNGKKYVVRVTPDPQKKHLQRIIDQIFFVQYLVKGGLNHICSPIPPLTQSAQKSFVLVGDLIIVVFEWALGKPLDFMEFRWMKDRQIILAWGRFLAQLHKASKKFAKEYPQMVNRIQKWDDIHCGAMKGTKLHEEDIVDVDNIEHYGVLHGDLNFTNFYYVDEKEIISVYDTDQVKIGFFLFDVALACFTPVMLQDGGMPMSAVPIEGINCYQFIDTIVEGYQSEGFKVDRARLNRMIDLTKQLAVKFGRKVKAEGAPAQVQAFFDYIQKYLQPKWKVGQ